jgi:phosphoglycolate phosphatase
MLMNLKDFLFLFDIDGTIIDTRGDGKKALFSAIDESLDIKINEEYSLLGGIDNVVFDYFYNISGKKESARNFYWKKMKDIYKGKMIYYSRNDWIIFQNAYESILYLEKVSNIGLATGNIKIGSDIKLGKFNLDKVFKSGGFGEKAKNRSEIVHDAITSSEKVNGENFDRNKIFLFGDTEKDIKSAIDNGIIPVLIDPLHKNREKAVDWKAEYYGDFASIDNFLRLLPKSDNKTVFFNV